VTAEHGHDSATLLCGSSDCVHDLEEIPRDEDIRQRLQESGKAAVTSRR